MADKLDNSAPFNDDQGTRVGKPTGAGAEAAEGIHGAPKQRDAKRKPSDNTSLEDRESIGDEARPGSEPFDSSSHQHRSGYGGNGGTPRQSNDGKDQR